MKIELAKTEIIHFVGIGGIGMSGLSLIMKGMGFNVQGSDINNNKNIDRLKKNKIKISIKHKKKNIEKATILVISSAIKKGASIVISNAPSLAFKDKVIIVSDVFNALISLGRFSRKRNKGTKEHS